MMRAYETRRMVLVGLMLYATPSRGCAWREIASPLYKSPRMPRLKRPVVIIDGVLDIHGKLLDVGVPVIKIVRTAARQVVR